MRRAILLACAVVAGACIVSKPIRVDTVDPRGEPVRVESPVKAHLLDGSTVVFEGGVTVERDAVVGSGMRYDLAQKPLGPVQSVPLDSVGAMESFPSNRDMPRTVTYTAVSAVAGFFGTALLMVAVFGSCPTVYSDGAGRALLEAEAFSYSIAPIFEARDVDRLAGLPDAEGRLFLDVRNEALETHSINHVELLDVEHDPAELVFPDERNLPLVVGELAAPRSLMDRAGRDLRSTLEEADGLVFGSAPEVRDRVTADDFEDWIDVVADRPADADSVAVVLRLRNSLLNTVLLYDVMLKAQGAAALDWVGRDLARVGEAAELGRWYHSRMGMRLTSGEDGRAPFAKRLADAGPIAWKDVAVVVPVPREGPVRVRLSFAADQWRIDRIQVAARVARPETRIVPVAEVLDGGGSWDAPAAEALRASDDAYLVTSPGTSFSLRFDLPPVPPGRARTLMLASQGYYVEWIRGDWIRNGGSRKRFEPTDQALLEAMRRWRDVQPEFEGRFYAARVPTR